VFDVVIYIKIMKFNLATFVKYLKRANFVLAVFFLVLSGIVFANFGPNLADAFVTDPQGTTQYLRTNQGGTFPVTYQQTDETLSEDGVYTVTYRFSEDRWRELNNPVDVSFPVRFAIYKCPEGNGRGPLGICDINPTGAYETRTIVLNAANDWTSIQSNYVQQDGAVPCGSFQSDIASTTAGVSDDSGFLGGALTRTGKDLGPNCHVTNSPTPTPTPTPSVNPTPTPSATPTPSVTPTPYPSHTPYPTPTPSHTPHPTPAPMPEGQCPTSWFEKIFGSAIVCVAQNQEQNQAQVQNNNQNQDVNQNVFATGGSSSSSSSSSSNTNVTVNNNR